MGQLHEHGKRNRLRADDDEPGAFDGAFGERTFADLEAQYPSLTGPLPYDDVLDGASGDYPQSWLALDPGFLAENRDLILRQSDITLTPDFAYGYRVARETDAYYLKGNFSDISALFDLPYSGNVGVRYVTTDQVAEGASDQGDRIVPILDETEYDDWLPSLNVAFELDEETYLRFGAAMAIAWPSLNDAAPFRRVQFFALAGNGGNPDLEPKIVGQFDVSLEHYFGEANLLSLAYFHEDFEDRVSIECVGLASAEIDPTPGDDGCAVGEELIRFAVPANVGAAKVNRIEIGYQQTYDFLPAPFDGFGALANYTYVDVDGGGALSATGRVLPVQDLSEHSYNLVGFYEKGGFSTRLAYNWRSEFFNERTSTNQASFREPYGQLDGSLSLDIGKNATLTFDAVNILNEPEVAFQEIEERLVAYNVKDRRFLVGVRLRN